MEALEDIIKFPSFIVCAIKPGQCVQRLTPHWRIFRNLQPELFGFFLEIPFRSKTRKIKFALRLFVCRLLGGTPECFGLRRGLARLPHRNCMISKA